MITFATVFRLMTQLSQTSLLRAAFCTTRTTYIRDMSRFVDLTRDIVTGVLSRGPRVAPFPVAARYKLACVSCQGWRVCLAQWVLCRGRTASACPRQSGALVLGAWV